MDIKIKNNSKYEGFKRVLRGEINPKRKWGIFVIIFIIGTIVLGLFSVCLYKNVQSGKFFENENKNPFVPEKINLINLDKTVLIYEGISEKFKTLQRVKLVDPSL